jgi:hypothetical protein
MKDILPKTEEKCRQGEKIHNIRSTFHKRKKSGGNPKKGMFSEPPTKQTTNK